MLLLLLRCWARLPLFIAHFFGSGVGLLSWLCSASIRKRIRSNASYAGIKGIKSELKIAINIGQGLLELPYVWFNTSKALSKVCCDNDTHQQLTQLRNHGVVFLTPHWGCFEIAARYYAQYQPLTALFKLPHKAWLLPILESARQTSLLKIAPANRQGVKQLFQALKRNEGIGILPDQVPSQGDGLWVPFFGQMAYTMNLPVRLAQQANATIIIAGAERLSWGRGWRLHLTQLEDTLPDTPNEQATLINHTMETMILKNPHQYLWSYNRYKTPAGVIKP